MEGINSDVFKLLEELEEILEDSTNVPFSRKVAVDKETMIEKLRDIKIGLPNQFKQAEWINKEKQRILDDAKKDADSLIEKTEQYVKEKVSEHELTTLAKENARRIEEEATLTSQQIKEGARDYAIEMLTKLHSNIEKINSRIEKNIKELQEYDL